MGLYTQQDPIGIAGGLNLYGYANGDPVNYSDPFGLRADPCTAAGIICPGAPTAGPGEAAAAAGAELGRTVSQLFGAVGAFIGNYLDMREANTIGADQYFHCMANCQAAQQGEYGEFFSEVFGDFREFVDQLTGDPASASQQDQQSNLLGRQGGAANPTRPCELICIIVRPEGLDPEYE